MEESNSLSVNLSTGEVFVSGNSSLEALSKKLEELIDKYFPQLNKSVGSYYG